MCTGPAEDIMRNKKKNANQVTNYNKVLTSEHLQICKKETEILDTKQLVDMLMQSKEAETEQHTLPHFASINDRLLHAGCCNRFLPV